MSVWSPSYRDCDNIISDIYALTHTARMRRRAELGLDKLRISEVKDESLSPKCVTRPNISSIQSRPLPTPGLYPTNRQSDHIYQSPIRMGHGPGTGRVGGGQYQFGSRHGGVQPPSNIPTARYHPQSSRIPLAVSQQSISQNKSQQATFHQPQSRGVPSAFGQGAPMRTHGLELGKDRRLSSHVGLGSRAVTELDFSRHRPSVTQSSSASNGPSSLVRAPSVTDTSEHSSPAGMPSSSLLGSDSCVRKGVMWVQQEKLFSRWKERFIILTSSYLHIFKKSTSRISDMGTFVNKIRLSEIENLSIEERKGYLTLVLVTSRDSRLLLRKTEGIREWQRSIEQQLAKEKQRHREMQSTNEFWNRKQFSDCHNSNASQASQWLLVRDNIGHKYGYLSRMSPNNFHSETEDSGFESLVTVTSDSSSNSSRMVSPHPPVPTSSSNPSVPHQMMNVRNGPNGHLYERTHYQFYNYNNRK